MLLQSWPLAQLLAVLGRAVSMVVGDRIPNLCDKAVVMDDHMNKCPCLESIVTNHAWSLQPGSLLNVKVLEDLSKGGETSQPFDAPTPVVAVLEANHLLDEALLVAAGTWWKTYHPKQADTPLPLASVSHGKFCSPHLHQSSFPLHPSWLGCRCIWLRTPLLSLAWEPLLNVIFLRLASDIQKVLPCMSCFLIVLKLRSPSASVSDGLQNVRFGCIMMTRHNKHNVSVFFVACAFVVLELLHCH